MNIYDKINEKAYKNLKPYPTFEAPKVEAIAGYTLDKDTHPAFVEAMRACKAARAEGHQEENRLIVEVFKADLFAYLNITGHPKAELLFNKAWGLGHPAGLYEVANIADDLVELIK